MLMFEEFIQEGKELEDRNKAIDLKNIIKTVFAKNGVDDQKAIDDVYNYMADKKTFSLGKMVDTMPYKTGHLKSIIAAVKDEITAKGYGKTTSVGKTMSQADRIDRHLKDVNRAKRMR